MKCRQQGVTMLIVLLLSACLALTAVWSLQGVISRQRDALLSLHAQEAQLAQQSALVWAAQQLSQSGHPSVDCLTQQASAATLSTTLLTGQPWRCLMSDTGWSVASPGSRWRAFQLQGLVHDASAWPARLTLNVTACAGAGLSAEQANCDALHRQDGARTQGTWHFIRAGGLRRSAPAPLIAGRHLDAGSSTVGQINLSGGPLLVSGGTITSHLTTLQDAANAWSTDVAPRTLTWGPTPASSSPFDPWAAFFLSSPADVQAASVLQLDCPPEDCTEALRQALAPLQQDPLNLAIGPIWLNGDTCLCQAMTLGQAHQPILLLSAGHLRLHPRLSGAGMLLAHDLVWDDEALAAPSGAARWQGALVAEQDLTLHARAQVLHDEAVLNALSRHTGRWVPWPATMQGQ